MRLVGNALRDELAAAWERWGHRADTRAGGRSSNPL